MSWRSPSGPAGEVGAMTVLKNQPESDKALAMLKEIHQIVKPIMKKHGWYLPQLSEFIPAQKNLLGVNYNRGQRICLRLRPPEDRYSFLPIEDCVLHTMLHELTHNERSPHDDTFFKILASLEEELDFYRKKHYLSFSGGGRRVGEGVSHSTGVSLRQAREAALRRIEEREKLRRLLGSGGKLGGGGANTSGKSRSEVIADAAERRLRATKTCGGDDAHNHFSGSKDLPPDVQAAIDDADKNSRRIVIDLTHLDSDSDSDDVVLPEASTSKVKLEDVERESTRAGSAGSASTAGSKRSRSASASPSSDSEIEIVSERPASKPLFLPPPSSSKPSRPSSARLSVTTSAKASRPSTSASTRPPPKAASRSRLVPPAAPSNSSSAHPSASSSAASSRPFTRYPTPLAAWTCPHCTFANSSPLSLACDVCLSPRPAGTLVVGAEIVGLSDATEGSTIRGAREVEDGWACEMCTTRNDHGFWTCRVCGKMKRSSERG